MKVEILHIEECPNHAGAGARVGAALDEAGFPDDVLEYRLLRTPEEASAAPFAESPTILLDSVDMFPTDGRTSDLACRVYVTERGLAGMPSMEQLREALARIDGGQAR